jgi:hypothetical protein
MRSLPCALPLILSAACSSGPRTIRDPAERFTVDGCSVTTPGADGWQLLHHDGEVVSFGKPVGSDGQVLTAAVALTPFRFESFDRMFEELRKEPPEEDERFRRPQSTVKRVGVAKPPYVEVRLEVEDHGVPGAQGRRMTSRGVTRWYRRAADGAGVTVSFSERRPLGATAADASAAEQRFFDGFRLDGSQ